MSDRLPGSDPLADAVPPISLDGGATAVAPVPYVSKESISSQRMAAAALAGGLIASGKSTYEATPADAVRAYQDIFDLLGQVAPSSVPA